MKKYGMVRRCAKIILDGVYVTVYHTDREEETWHTTIGDIVIKIHDIVILVQKVFVIL